MMILNNYSFLMILNNYSFLMILNNYSFLVILNNYTCACVKSMVVFSIGERKKCEIKCLQCVLQKS